MNEEMRRLADNDFDAPTFSRLNRRFHFMLYEHCPHRHLRDLIEAEWDRLDAIGRSGFAFAPQRAHVSVAEHEEILDLISARADDAELETKARLHKLHTIDAVLATHTPAGTQAHEATGGST